MDTSILLDGSALDLQDPRTTPSAATASRSIRGTDTSTAAFSAAGMAAWRDTPVALAFALELPPTPEQIDAAIASAIAATGARSMADAGRTMAWLVHEHPHWNDRRMLHERLRARLTSLTPREV